MENTSRTLWLVLLFKEWTDFVDLLKLTTYGSYEVNCSRTAYTHKYMADQGAAGRGENLLRSIGQLDQSMVLNTCI